MGQKAVPAVKVGEGDNKKKKVMERQDCWNGLDSEAGPQERLNGFD